MSLAHHGVLFLDELPEFDRGVLEVLREPLESGCVTISRAARQAEFPATFQLDRRDESLPVRLSRRRAGPLSLHGRASAALSQPAVGTAASIGSTCTSKCRACRREAAGEQIGERRDRARWSAARVLRAREQQIARQGTLNARLDNKAVERFCAPTREAIALLNRAADDARPVGARVSPHIEGGADDRGSGAGGRDRRRAMSAKRWRCRVLDQEDVGLKPDLQAYFLTAPTM